MTTQKKAPGHSVVVLSAFNLSHMDISQQTHIHNHTAHILTHAGISTINTLQCTHTHTHSDANSPSHSHTHSNTHTQPHASRALLTTHAGNHSRAKMNIDMHTHTSRKGETQESIQGVRMCVCMCICTYVNMRVCVCVYACMCESVC